MNRPTALAFALIALLVCAGPVCAADAAPNAEVRRQLRASGVPVLLPMPPPKAIGPIRSIAVISADRTGYYVGYSSVAHCGGALSCAGFHVAGMARTPIGDRPDQRQERLRLPDGTVGYVVRADCSGAGCTEASLFFARGSAIYEIDVTGGAGALPILRAAYSAMRRLR